MNKSKSQFDLFSILEWTAAVAFLCALLAGASSRSSWTTGFPSLPPDDSSLTNWLLENNYRDVIISRADNSIQLERETSVLNDAGIRGLPKPPWTELGYPSPTGARGRFNWTLFSGSTYLWLSGFGVLVILGQVRKAVIRARRRKSIENRDE